MKIILTLSVLALALAFGAAPATAQSTHADIKQEAVYQDVPLSRKQRVSVQRGLAKLGFDPGPPDGLFGPRTRAAILEWQHANELEPTSYLTAYQADGLQILGESAEADNQRLGSVAARSEGCPDIRGIWNCDPPPTATEMRSNQKIVDGHMRYKVCHKRLDGKRWLSGGLWECDLFTANNKERYDGDYSRLHRCIEGGFESIFKTREHVREGSRFYRRVAYIVVDDGKIRQEVVNDDAGDQTDREWSTLCNLKARTTTNDDLPDIESVRSR